jgi:hypothetical protein
MCDAPSPIDIVPLFQAMDAAASLGRQASASSPKTISSVNKAHEALHRAFAAEGRVRLLDTSLAMPTEYIARTVHFSCCYSQWGVIEQLVRHRGLAILDSPIDGDPRYTLGNMVCDCMNHNSSDRDCSSRKYLQWALKC